MSSTFSCGTQMPGSFTFESTLTPKLDVSVGAKSHIFQPPPTSATSSLHFSHASLSTSASRDDRSNTKRKRSRHDGTSSTIIQPSYASTNNDALSSMAYDPSTSACDLPESMESPAPFVNEKYRLAGGLDTPTSRIALDHDYFNPGAGDFQSRTGRSLRSIDHPDRDGHFNHSPIPSALARERNGQPRIATSPNIRDGLGRTLYHVADVAGKVLDFCRSAAFRGFFAGGGASYDLKGASIQKGNGMAKSVWHQVEEKDLGFWRDSEGVGTPVPGQFPDDDFIPDYMSQDHLNPSPTRAAKRIQRERRTSGEIGENWMMVGERGTPPASREASPSRISTRKIPASTTSSGRRTAPKLGRARPILPASRPYLNSCAGSPSMRSDRPASYASPRSPGGAQSPPKKHDTNSPLSVEVQKHAARMRRREMEEDKNLSRFNQQLKAMIREGKEALGTRVEVEDEIG